MKILFLQISDIHCGQKYDIYESKIEAAVNALATLKNIDKLVFIFSGDLTAQASRNQFKTGRKIIGAFLSKLNKKFGVGFIETLIVPGNHDMIINKEDRGFDQISKWKLDDHIPDELNRLDSFFDYAVSKKCFVENKLCDKKILNLDGYKIKVSLLNSALFSTREKNDKELHYIPKTEIEKEIDEEYNLSISIMHHSYEWFDWKIIDTLKKYFKKEDIVFFGHDHKAESICLTNGDGITTNLVLGGEFTVDNNCSFNSVVVDTESGNINTYKFYWIESASIFKVEPQKNSGFVKNKAILHPSEQYLEKLSFDNQNLCEKFIDYYVFPKLKSNDESVDDKNVKVDLTNIFEILNERGVIAINGNNRVGKTALIKYLYIQSIEKGYYPLLIEKKDYKDNNIEKMMKNMVEMQYADIEYSYDKFLQIAPSKIIIFIDDFDLVSNVKARENLFTYMFSHSYLLVYTSKDYMSQELTTIVKEKIQNSNIYTLEILPFYKEKRDELVNNVCLVTQGNREIDSDNISLALDYMVQCNPDFFSLTPSNLIQYIKYFINNSSNDDKGTKTISVIFETNIRNSIIDKVNPVEVKTYLSALEFLANYMYFAEETDKITTEQLSNIIPQFNKERKASLNPKTFIKNCCDAKILIESDSEFSYSFCDKNTFAYFIAKFINRELEKNPGNLEHVNFIMNNICFGINDIIVLFLSYVRNNSRIIIEIATKAIDILKDDSELDFDENNIPFLKEGKELSRDLPTNKDKEEKIKITETIEKDRHDNIKFRGIFDYPKDRENKQYHILRAFKYTQLIARALVDQYGDLENDEINTMVSELYSVTQKVAYGVLKPYSDNYAKVIDDLKLFVASNPDINMSDEELTEVFNKSALMLVLNLMNDIAFNASNSSTLTALCDVKLKNSNYKLHNLMMYENAGNSTLFVDKAVEFYKDFSSNPFAKSIVSQIAVKHILNTKNFDRRDVDRLISGRVLNSAGKKQYLLKSIKNEAK